MKTLHPNDFQKIDLEIQAQVGKCSQREQIAKLKDLAEIYRVYASRSALMARELYDERKYL
jgi:hypothetical protein